MLGKNWWRIVTTGVWSGLILLLTCIPISAQANIQGMVIDTVNARTGPGTEHAVITMIPVRTQIAVEGRNQIGNWVLVHTLDNALRGWVASRYTIWEDDTPLDMLPVTAEILAAPASSLPPASENAAENPQPAPAAPAASPMMGGITGQTLDTLNVRTGPDGSNTSLGKIAPHTAIIIEGRNAFGNWVLMRAADNSLRGWVASRYTIWDDSVLLESLPVIVEEVGIPAPEVVMNSGNTPLSVSGTETDMMNTLAAIPVVPAISANAQAIYQRGQTMGNNPQNFTKIGDSNSASQAYLGLIGIGAYDLGRFHYLQATIDYYKGGSENSFIAQTPTAQSGMVTTSIIDPLFSDPSFCGGGRSPLVCELDRSHPSIALIYLGEADNKLLTHDEYTNALRQIVEGCINRGAIPVLTTMPTKPHYQQTQQRPLEFNMIIINIAREYDIPLINMWRAVNDLPEHGLQDDLLHFTYSGEDYLDFNGGQDQWGYTAWNLAVLQTLDAIRKAVG